MTSSRRDFLKGIGALIVSFSAGAPLGDSASAQDSMGTRPSHIDPAQLDSWLAFGEDGRVTAFTGKCDFGQGMYTAQTQLVAEELCVALDRVIIVQCDTAHTPDQGHTSGSQSTPTNFNTENLALAAATAREALLQMAAQHLGQPVEGLKVEQGVVRTQNGQQVRYEELIGAHRFHLSLNKAARRRPRSEWTVLGTSVPSLDRPALMTGQFEYVQYVRVPGMLHGRVIRPPSMGATLAHVDESSVQGLPGLVKVVRRQNYLGIVAETQWAAIRAARELKVQWTPGPGLPDQGTYYEEMTRLPAHDSFSVDSADVEAALARAPRHVRARYSFPFQMHGSVGTSCAVADVQPGEATVWSSTQSAYPTRSIVAKLLNVPQDSVRVIYTRGSGCYGLNGADAVSFDAALLSQAVGRPVRVQFSRWDEMAWENFGSACVIEQKAGLASDGTLVAWDREDWVAELGGRPGYDRPGNVISGMLAEFEPYVAPPGPAEPPGAKFRNGSNTVPAYMAGCVGGECGGNGVIRSERVLTHTVRAPHFTGSLRSPLRFQNTFANECFMDELAAEAKADPVAYRLQHLKDPRLIGVLKAAAERAGWESRPSPQRRADGHGAVVSGRGVACVAYEGNNGYAALVAEVNVNLETGEVKPARYVVAVDCGPVSNPDGLRNQTEGGMLQGTSRSLVEEVTWTPGGITSTDWETYKSLSLGDEMPPIEIVHVEAPGVPASGAGETAITVTPAALGNAIFDATGARLREIPYTPARVKAALHATRTGDRKRA